MQDVIKTIDLSLPTISSSNAPEQLINSEKINIEQMQVPENQIDQQIHSSNLNDNMTIKSNKQQEMSLNEKLDKSEKYKDEGIKLFSEKKFNDAGLNFRAGLELLYGEGLSQKARDLMLSHNLNLCNCFNNLGAYQNTIERTDFSLKLRKDHPKIYYYRAIAYININDINKAESDYQMLSELIPNTDPALHNVKNLIDIRRPIKDETETKKIFKSMFKSGVYNDREKDKVVKRKSSDDEDEIEN
jgi:tetratricopeptide (TPR) repeat protein